MLARQLEVAGIATVLITPMPFWSEKIGTPRTLAVEHPFGRILGQPFDTTTQTNILRAALNLLETATAAGETHHSDIVWSLPTKETIAVWQPQEPSPIIAVMAPIVRARLKERRTKNRKS